MRYLGVDCGSRRTGVAISDPDGRIATPHSVVEHASWREQVEGIARIARAEGAQAIVVGWPVHMDGSAGESARRARRLAGRLSACVSLSVVLWDERLTTRQADSALRAAGLDGRARRARVDKVAAALILQSYLDHIHHVVAGAAPGPSRG
jgi:putative Holliday junction resolvase